MNETKLNAIIEDILNMDSIKKIYLELRGLHDTLIVNKRNETNIKFIKSQILIYAGLYNKNLEMFNKGKRDYKKYGLEILEIMSENGNHVMYAVHWLESQHDDEVCKGVTSKNSEAYRQFAEQLKRKQVFYDEILTMMTQSKNWFNK